MLIAWESGDWCVFDNSTLETRASGQAASLARAKERVIAAYQKVIELREIERTP